MRVRALSIHAAYRCGHSGVCCSSGWEIPVEPEVELTLRLALAEGRLVTSGPSEGEPLRPRSGLPHGARVVLATDPGGRCAFLEPGPRCAIHRQLGERALSSACRQFPRVVTLTPLGVSGTLCHSCPTAAELLFSSPEPLRIVEQPQAFPAERSYEGLDARDAWPPLLRPGVLMSWAALEHWEHHAVSLFADQRLAPEQGLARLAAEAEAARAWTSAAGPFEPFFARCLERAEGEAEPGVAAPAEVARAWSTVDASVPAGHPRLEAPDTADRQAWALVDAGWRAQQAPLRRWLAARAFASWLALQGGGLRTTVLGLRLSLLLLRAESLRGCAQAGRPLDAALMKQAVRRADLLLVQLADPAALARRLAPVESAVGADSLLRPGRN